MEKSRKTGLARVLSKLGYCSRTEGAALIRAGRVKLNGIPRRDPETPVYMDRDKVTVDDAPLGAAQKTYWILNKPRGLVTTAADERGRDTVYSLLPQDAPWMGPVGRLDKASEGLLLMTNDTEWAAQITAPESHVTKTYHVQIAAIADDALVAKFGDAKLLRTGDKNCWIEVLLDEGKNRQIRRMAEAAGVEVLRLIRVAIGDVLLGDLPKGAARPLTPDELRSLS